eukprot:7430096-Pyramimonas_sp.AAC.1
MAARVSNQTVRDAWPFMSAETLRKTSPSNLKHNIDEKRQTAYRTAYCEYLKKAGMELKLYALSLETLACFAFEFALLLLRREVPLACLSAYCFAFPRYLTHYCFTYHSPQLTIATAVVFSHRFFTRQSFGSKENDIKVS